MNIWWFLNTNFFIALVTLLVGTFAIIIYIKSKQDYKRDIVMAVLVEIRNAEELVEKLIAGERPINLVLIPVRNWNRYNYLLVKDFDEDELNLINDFFARCSVIDKSLPQLSTASQIEQKAKSIQDALVQLAKEDPENYQIKKIQLTTIMQREDYSFSPLAPAQEITNALNNFRFITTSSVDIKLKKMTKQKKFWLL